MFAHAAETPIPPVPARWVTDTAGFMSVEGLRSLDMELEAYERSSGQQLLVYIGKTTGGVPIEDWAVRAFQAWKVGRKGLDDGLALFIMSEDRRLRIEVGYGLEGQVPDAMASRIVSDVIVPRVQSGDRDGAVAAGMDAVARTLTGRGLSESPVAQRGERGRGSRPLTIGQLVFFGIIGVLFLVLLATNPALAIYLVASILSGNREGSYRGGGGGGFSGGGGRSGGGGASGSW
ncbi:MAG TPA: TPM domain-containing protein [Terriglobia bacterium]|nr:TPM domain-containing protein [Terriglobia bacterium]